MKIYLISVLIGAIIGYSTNWLAIKMLFRPHNEKRIFGVKIPFTPGLIPKERGRIAQSVGKTVGEHLLTPEAIKDALNKPEIKNNIKLALDDKVTDVLDSNKSLKDLLDKILGNNQNIENYFKLKLHNGISKLINSDDLRNKIKIYFNDIIDKELSGSPESLYKLVNEKKLRDIIIDRINSAKNDELIKELLVTKGREIVNSDKKLNEILHKDIIGFIDNIVLNDKDDIAEMIIDELKSGSLSDKIKLLIAQNIPSIMSMFINVDSIYEKLVETASVYLNDENSKEYICNMIISYIHKGFEKPINELFKDVSDDQLDNITEIIAREIDSNILNEESLDKYITKLESYLLNIKSYDELINLIDKNYKDKIQLYISKKVDEILDSKEIIDNINTITDKYIEELLMTPVNDMVENKDMIINGIFVIIEQYYNNFIGKDAMNIVKVIDIPAIVESQINSFDFNEGEEMILSIASKELKAITWLGALLGAILGIITPLLSTFYMK